ncbi:MAG: sporulation protein YunB [Candidatus Syntrophopropionicum ammoniitolerans]
MANLGPRLKYNIMPAGTVRVNVVDKFETAGINQTRHAIYLNFDTNVRIVIPFKGGEAVIAMQVPLVESIIVGGVPSTFVSVQGGILGSGLLK